ncbi:hypothetical protein PVL29_001774 [Vitis rotundifolia]|uniref:Uncharacterized protein n=1 Tax=Vitis rotundifolia TaxID=103349 RepID=A0AA39AFT6_VITRO|nr:hypothetical protein PVL29_001774 [Vitis rotundifolia]
MLYLSALYLLSNAKYSFTIIPFQSSSNHHYLDISFLMLTDLKKSINHNNLEAGIGGLNSKTHMKIMLEWMRGRKMLKLFCNHVGSSKKFLHCTLPEDPEVAQLRSSLEHKPQTKKRSVKRKK